MDERPRQAWPPEEPGHRVWPPEGAGRKGQHRARPSDEPERAAWPSPEPGRRRRQPVDDVPRDDLPPSARLYGAPIAPPGRRIPGRLRRRLPGLVALVAGAGVVIAGAVLAPRILPASAPPATRVSDPDAGVGYPLPQGWRAGTVPPVTAFTAVAGSDGTAGGDGVATVMSRPVEPAADARKAAVELADLYARLLLHGDEVEVVDERPVTVGGRTGYSRSLRAEYRDVVNRPAYLRVVFLTGAAGRPVVMMGMAQPDDPRLRAEIDTVIAGVR
ncbi:hypothetical protein ACQPYK_09550 [Streptosporangium sp. CA-135522]|uniref:hypothetical protein n=1 Tax=Streptosporangium sp. CA-135522 TaxID=3240072 RepID=UPI003D8F41F4